VVKFLTVVCALSTAAMAQAPPMPVGEIGAPFHRRFNVTPPLVVLT
jgi:hypothetical protein